MAKINLVKKSSSLDPNSGSYSIVLEVLSTEVINKNVFIKQRLRNYIANNFDDVFVAIATPAQLEDFDTDSPKTGDSFFRTDRIQLTSRNPAYLEEVFEAILRELQKLVDDFEALSRLTTDGIYTIESEQITFNDKSLVHTHYRIPLAAKPAGNSETFTADGIDYQRVTSQDTDLTGWLNTTSPTGYKFKYNIDADTTLSPLWPIDPAFINLAHIELNGITVLYPDLLINEDGIFWKNNVKGYAPWPEDYVNESDQGTDKLTLVLDMVAPVD